MLTCLILCIQIPDVLQAKLNPPYMAAVHLQLLNLNPQTTILTTHMHFLTASTLNYPQILELIKVNSLEIVLLTQKYFIFLETHIDCVVY